MTMIELNPESKAPHAYGVGVWDGKDPKTITDVLVRATNRDQAARIAESAGYVARDVNMVG